MDIFAMVQWNISPEIFRVGPLAIRWYGVLFASGFFFGYLILSRIFAREMKKQVDLDNLTIYMVLGTVLGARLGHCLFYAPAYYLANPFEILKIWEGGLASHGAALGNLFALYLFSKKHSYLPFLWVTDRIVVVVALAGGLIRIGNLMNSEIIGRPADVAWAFVFPRVDMLPRHPTQIYEALAYFSIFGFLYFLYQRYKSETPSGLLFGWFLTLVFGVRIAVEFLKENQEAFERFLPLNMGQLLSIPLVLLGIFLILRAKKPVKSI